MPSSDSTTPQCRLHPNSLVSPHLSTCRLVSFHILPSNARRPTADHVLNPLCPSQHHCHSITANIRIISDTSTATLSPLLSVTTHSTLTLLSTPPASTLYCSALASLTPCLYPRHRPIMRHLSSHLVPPLTPQHGRKNHSTHAPPPSPPHPPSPLNPHPLLHHSHCRTYSAIPLPHPSHTPPHRPTRHCSPTPPAPSSASTTLALTLTRTSDHPPPPHSPAAHSHLPASWSP